MIALYVCQQVVIVPCLCNHQVTLVMFDSLGVMVVKVLFVICLLLDRDHDHEFVLVK